VSWTCAPDGDAAITVKSLSALGTHGAPLLVAVHRVIIEGRNQWVRVAISM
jgi:hypothetical protein